MLVITMAIGLIADLLAIGSFIAVVTREDSLRLPFVNVTLTRELFYFVTFLVMVYGLVTLSLIVRIWSQRSRFSNPDERGCTCFVVNVLLTYPFFALWFAMVLGLGGLEHLFFVIVLTLVAALVGGGVLTAVAEILGPPLIGPGRE